MAVSRPRGSRRPIRTLNLHEVQRLLKAAAGDRLEALYKLAVGTGLRQGELLGLRWGDVDLDAATLTVQRTLLDVNGQLEVGEPKTARSRRRVEPTGT